MWFIHWTTSGSNNQNINVMERYLSSAVSDKYQIKSLMDLGEQSLIAKLNMQTITHYLVVVHLHTAPQLLDVYGGAQEGSVVRSRLEETAEDASFKTAH
jgi:hypothetical protein